MNEIKRALLQNSLALAVPMWQKRIKENPEHYFALKDKLTQTIASKGDSILYKTSETAQSFNDLALAIALLSFNPSGITVFDVHFQIH